MKHKRLNVPILVGVLIASLGLAGSVDVFAQPPGREGGAMRHGPGHHPRHMPSMGGGRHGPGGHPQRHRLLGTHWKSTLSDDQRMALDRLHLAHAKAKMPLKARLRLLKMELSVLATTDENDSAAIHKKIDELLSMKREMMRQRYQHITATRKILNPDQRISFDMEIMKSARNKGGPGRKGHH